MSARAYAEPYAQRRHARHLQRQQLVLVAKPAKKAQLVPLIPQQFKHAKSIELIQPKYSRIKVGLLLGLVVGLHLVAFHYFHGKPVPEEIKRVATVPIKVERYVPPEIPPQVIQPEPPKPQPKEPPKPVKSKPAKPPVEHVNPNVIEQRVAPPAPETPAPAKATGPSADAGYLNNPAPTYPELAQERGWEGSVLLTVVVLPTGKPKTVEVKQSSGRKVLDDAAVATVKNWSFVPAKLGSETIEASVEVPIDFRLANN
ncbi:MAG: energy transducer TonB [Moraxellaceae bacterium]|nr:MAG: energy transducer TonB [Moraxellaceae bacterium]